jgi:AraC-like DNA-binding protein
MKKPNFVYVPHLVLQEHGLAPQDEWMPRFDGLTIIQVRQGTGYYLKSQLNQELPTGTVLVLGESAEGTIRASQIGEFSLSFFSVIPSRLGGLLTWGEQRAFEQIVARRQDCLKIFPPPNRLAEQMDELCTMVHRRGLGCRLSMLQLLAEVFVSETVLEPSRADASDAAQRLEMFLNQTPISDLLEMNFSEIAQMTNCTSRHLSRLFQKLVGMSFNDKRAELRLARALDLLSTSDLKVVDVALESGFKSLSQFNQVFARHFGVSPGRWRLQNGGESTIENARKPQRSAQAKAQKFVFKLDPLRKTLERSLAASLNPVSVD